MSVQSRIEDVLAPLGLDVGFSATHLQSGETVAINPRELFPTASVYKVPVMVELYRQADEGRFSISDRLELADAHRIIGSGVLQKLGRGLAPTIGSLFILRAPFEDAAMEGTWFCTSCAAMEGALLANPHWAARIDVKRMPHPRPRHDIIVLIGEENQSMPVLVLADGSVMGSRKAALLALKSLN
jgi:hypothetical protein